MSDDDFWSDDDGHDHGDVGHHGFDPVFAEPHVSGTSPEPAGFLELASDGDWTGSPLTVAVSAAGGVVISSFLQALGSKLGEKGAQIVQDAVKRPWWRRRSRVREERELAAGFIASVRTIADAQEADDGVVRLLNERHNVLVLVHDALPQRAVSQFRRLDLSDRKVSGTTLAWQVDWLDRRGAWKTVAFRDRRRTRDHYVWRDRRRRWVLQPWAPPR